MKGITHQIMKRHTKLWGALVAIVVGLVVGQPPLSAGTLDVDVYSPALPATETDIITLWALTSDEVLPSTSYQTVTMGLVVNGFDIQWDIISNDTGLGGAAVMTRAGILEDIGTLPAGTYNVTATWAMYDFVYYGQPSQTELDFWLLTHAPQVGPRTGTFQFTVVPEPATFALIAAGLGLCGIRRR